MNEIQCTNIGFAQRTIDDLVSRDKPFTLSLSPGDTGSLHHIAIQSDHLHSGFIRKLEATLRQRVNNGTGVILEVDSDADLYYHVLSSYIAEHDKVGVVKSLGEVS